MQRCVALVRGYRTEDISSVERNAGRCTFIFASKIGNSSSCISDGGTDSGKSNRALSESRNISVNTGMPFPLMPSSAFISLYVLLHTLLWLFLIPLVLMYFD